ncbi:threonine dehydratase [Escherichia coli]|uniref:L-threonine dehydratase n=1 Tax=Escherichia coli TaxID=562 RepID=A0A376TQ70_ECOLX|nr:threonine dehydratase [Escherichia coli]
MADSQPLSGAPEGAEYLRAVLRAPVYEAAQVTPLQKMEKLSSRLDNVILVKREDRQPVHSFKLRGAYAMMAGLTEEQKAHGVITASAGNHAQGVAFSSARLGVKALIVMPTATADIKVDAVRGFGGEVLLHGANFDEAKAKAIELSQQQGFTWVPPFDHPMVIAGQGTLALELLQQDAHLDRVFVPVGGGGLAAGVAVLIKQLMPQIKVIAVEAEDSACLKAALDAGHPVDLPRVGLFAEGVAVKRIGDETFRLCQEYLDDIITVDSDAICAAMKDLFEDVRAVAEPSGALALAGMKKYIAQHNIRGERLAHILSGANVNFHGLRYVSERCELGEQREALLAVTIPEEKGSFLKFCQLLGGPIGHRVQLPFCRCQKRLHLCRRAPEPRPRRAQRNFADAQRRRLQRGGSLRRRNGEVACALYGRRASVTSVAGTPLQLRIPGITGRAAALPQHAGYALEHFFVPLSQPWHRLRARTGGVRTRRP